MRDRDICVAGLGVELGRLWPEQPAVLPAPRSLSLEELPELTAFVERALREAERVVLVVPTWLGDEALRSVQTAVSVLESEQVALVGTDLPPLAAAVTAALAAAVSAHLDTPGALVFAIPQIERELIVLAWLTSVSGLKRPAPSLRQHARSLIPGRGFAAALQPEEWVRALSRSDTHVPLARVDRPMELLLAPTEEADVAWVVDVVNPGLGMLRLREIPPTAHGTRWWGAKRLAEVVAYPTDVEALAGRVAPQSLRSCHWCGATVATTPCPFCGERNRAAA